VKFASPATDDFFRSRIDHMIDLRHPLAVLASRMPWQEIEARVAQVFSRKGRAGAARSTSRPISRPRRLCSNQSSGTQQLENQS
jgi:hypothetical protein